MFPRMVAVIANAISATASLISRRPRERFLPSEYKFRVTVSAESDSTVSDDLAEFTMFGSKSL